MSIIREKKVKAFGNRKFMIEEFNSAAEVADISKTRNITNSSFTDYSNSENINSSWAGVKSYEEALDYMKHGYQPTVDEFKKGFKPQISGQKKRVAFHNDICGFAPIVPLAIQGIPTSMVNSRTTSIKSKVIDVYYNMSVNAGTSSSEIISAGQKILGAIMKLEMQGYKFNLYAVQTYYDSYSGGDVLCVKIKSSSTPLDLKRISFPLTHTAFFRVIGFDWYSRTPKGTYRIGYGHAMRGDFSEKELQSGFEEMFGKKCVMFDCASILRKDDEHIENMLSGKETR